MDTNILLVTCIISLSCLGLGVGLGYSLGRLNWLEQKLTLIETAPANEPNRQKKKKRKSAEGRLNADPVFSSTYSKPKSFNPLPHAHKIQINESKFVAPVKTDGMERCDANELGKTTVTEDGVQDAASRLAQLKGTDHG